jgi:hypothetical protein
MIITIRSEPGFSYYGLGREFHIWHLNVSRMQVLDGNVADCDLIDICSHRFVIDRVNWFGAEAVSRFLLERCLGCSLFKVKEHGLLTYFVLVCPSDMPSYYLGFVRQWSPKLGNWFWSLDSPEYWVGEPDCNPCSGGELP